MLGGPKHTPRRPEDPYRDVELPALAARAMEHAYAATAIGMPLLFVMEWFARLEPGFADDRIADAAVRCFVPAAVALVFAVLAVGMTERNGEKVHITHVVLDGNGVIGTHRKTSLAPGEEKTWDPGDDANVFEVKGIRVGIAICFESVHPPTCAKLRANGAEVICTGRNAPEELRKEADLVTVMTVEKHPYDDGLEARKGIEY